MKKLNWAKIARVIAMSLVGLIAFAFVASGVNSFNEFNRSLTAYYGVKGSDDRAEVLYRLGTPQYVVNHNDDKAPVYGTADDAIPKMPPGKTIGSYSRWAYDKSNDVTVLVTFRGDALKGITCYSMSGMPYACSPLAGVHIDDSEEEVLRKLGKPTSSKLDGELKGIRYYDINITFDLQKGRVVAMSLASGKSGFWTRFGRWSRLAR